MAPVSSKLDGISVSRRELSFWCVHSHKIQKQRDDELERSEPELHLSIDKNTQQGSAEEEYPEDQDPSIVWQLVSPEIHDQSSSVVFISEDCSP